MAERKKYQGWSSNFSPKNQNFSHLIPSKSIYSDFYLLVSGNISDSEELNIFSIKSEELKGKVNNKLDKLKKLRRRNGR